MKKVIILVLLAILISGCATTHQRAVKHVNKALRLDPQVLSEFNSPIRLDTTIVINEQIITPERKIYVGINEDSLRKVLEMQLGVKKMLVENDKLRVELERTKDGWFNFLATVKPDTLYFRDTIEIEIIKEVPVKGLIREVPSKGYFYYCGILLNILGAIFIFIFIWRLFRR